MVACSYMWLQQINKELIRHVQFLQMKVYDVIIGINETDTTKLVLRGRTIDPIIIMGQQDVLFQMMNICTNVCLYNTVVVVSCCEKGNGIDIDIDIDEGGK